MSRAWRWPWERSHAPAGPTAEQLERLAAADAQLAHTRSRWPLISALAQSIMDEGRENHLRERLQAAFEARR